MTKKTSNLNPDPDDVRLVELYEKTLLSTVELSVNYNPFEVAGCMMAVALALYRSGLSNEEYQDMCQTIFEKREDVTVFKPKYSH
jgi:hypothetical protein